MDGFTILPTVSGATSYRLRNSSTLFISSGTVKEDGAYCKNVCGTYVHGVFDKEDVAEAVVRALGEKKGIDVSQMAGVDFAAFKETQYDILAAELRKPPQIRNLLPVSE